MSANAYVRLARMLSGGPVKIGTVTAFSSGVAMIEYPGGAKETARGDTSVGQKVFVKDGVIQGEAPSLPVYEVEI